MTTRNTEHLAATVAEHIKADAVIQGDYWSEDEQKGCFIGCLVHGNKPHLIEERYGVPVMITKIAEAIFERLPADEAKQFFADFPAAINNDGKDLSRVGWQFLSQTLRDLPSTTAEVQAVVDLAIAGLDRLAKGEQWPTADAARDAALAAALAAAKAADWAATRAVAWAADAAATAAAASAAARAADWADDWAATRAAARYAAADAASARAAARSAAADARAAANAAAAARAAARSGAARFGAWTAAIRQQRDLLLRLIREA